MSEVKKLVCNVDSELLALVDEYAASLHINRTAAVSVLLSTVLKQDKMMRDLGRMMDMMDVKKES